MPIYVILNTEICFGDSLFLEGAWRYLPGTFTDSLQNNSECDSVVVTILDTTTICIWPTEIVYVDSSATGENTGDNWNNAYTDLQLALDVGSRYQNVRQIWIARGTYFPTQGLTRSSSFAISDSLSLLGGFEGIETDSSQRNPGINKSVLSGDIGVSGDQSDNTYSLVKIPVHTDGAILDGLEISGGNANGTQPDEQVGAALHVEGQLLVKACTIKDMTGIGEGYAVFADTMSALTIVTSEFLDLTDGAIVGNAGAEIRIIGTLMLR